MGSFLKSQSANTCFYQYKIIPSPTSHRQHVIKVIGRYRSKFKRSNIRIRKGVMNPKDPKENGTRGGTGPLNSDAACRNTEANNKNPGHDIYGCQSKNLKLIN